jgi:maltose alpha-D-glucosyltransferase/alpha-amylase
MRQQTGRRVAEMQLALASRDDIADFAPEPITAQDVELWTGELIERAHRAFETLTQRRSELAESDRPLVDALLARRDTLAEHIRTLLPEDAQAVKIRHHGDFHLGQMLIVKDDVFIIDFEGEPRRSLAERRRKAPAARDVAGLMRSIDYSATAALQRAVRQAPDDNGKIARALDDWRDRASASVLAAYWEAMSDPRLWPRETAEAERMLDFFLLEKVFYEIEYELAHRPDWLQVPLAGACHILARGEGGAS